MDRPPAKARLADGREVSEYLPHRILRVAACLETAHEELSFSCFRPFVLSCFSFQAESRKHETTKTRQTEVIAGVVVREAVYSFDVAKGRIWRLIKLAPCAGRGSRTVLTERGRGY